MTTCSVTCLPLCGVVPWPAAPLVRSLDEGCVSYFRQGEQWSHRTGVADKGRWESTERLAHGRSGGNSGLVSCLLKLQRRRDAEEGTGDFFREVSDRENERNNINLNAEKFSLSGESRDLLCSPEVPQWLHIKIELCNVPGKRCRGYHKLRYLQNITFVKAPENWSW